MRRRIARWRRWWFRLVFFHGERRKAAECLREVVRIHHDSQKGDPTWQEACEAAYTGLDDCLITTAARLEGWRGRDLV